MRICVAGGPRVGKTTYAETQPAPRLHTDDLNGTFGANGWSAESEAVARWFDAGGPWVVEGVTVPRALRKWLAAHPAGKPCDVVVWLDRPDVVRTKGQAAMAKAGHTVMSEVAAELVRRGVQIVQPQWNGAGWT